MFDILNDDCHLNIINYLSLVDQLTLYSATKGKSMRLNENLQYVWQHQISFTIASTQLKAFKENPQVLHDFLFCISSTVQELRFDWITWENLKHWANYEFPNVKKLKYSFDDDDTSFRDQVLELMVQTFPGVISATLCGEFNAKHLTNWKQLRRLDLVDSFNDYDDFKTIEKCQELREILMYNDIRLTSEHIDIIMNLPKLHTFAFHTGCQQNEIVHHIINLRGQDIHKISFTDSIWIYDINILRQMRNLRQLSLVEDDGFTHEQLRELISDLPLLEHLELVSSQIWRSEAELWEIVAACPTLKILNISNMSLYEDFFNCGRSVIERVLNKRSTPLTLHCYNTGEHEHLIRELFKHPKLKLCFEPIELDDFIEIYVHLQMRPLTQS